MRLGRFTLLVPVAAVVVAISLSVSFVLARGSVEGQWMITDLGVLDGTSSRATAINARGDIVGWIVTGSAAHAFLWRNGRMHDLGTLPLRGTSATESYPWGINDRGLVIGSSRAGNPGSEHAFLWREGAMIDLFPSENSVDAKYTCCVTSSTSQINERGQIVGMRATADTVRATLWQDGRRFIDLGVLPERNFSEAIAINARGSIVGNSYAGLDDSGGYCMVSPRAFSWENGRFRDLGTLPGDRASVAVAINDQGQVVGHSGTADAICGLTPTPLRPFLFSQGRMQRLNIPGSGSVTQINNGGQVIGSMHPYSQSRAFLWQNGTTTDLGTVLWRTHTVATALNDRGQVVGSSCADGEERCRGFLWERGKLIDLGTLPGGDASNATAINANGQIVGYSTTESGETHAVLWTIRGG